jgi:hypothetical protein
MTATKKTPGKKTTTPAKKAPPTKASKPAKKPVPPATEAAPVAPPYPGYEPYDVVQVCDDGNWADFETIRTPEEGEQARKLCDLTGERTYRIVSGDKQTVKVAPPAPKPEPKTRTKKAKPESKPKKLSALDAAAKVLVTTGEPPMTTKAMIEAMTERGLWTSPGGKTPQATLYAAILREVATKGTKARFRKTAPGHFAFNTESTQD